MESLVYFIILVVLIFAIVISWLYDRIFLTSEERAQREADYQARQEANRLAEITQKEEDRVRAGEMQGQDLDELNGEYQFMSKIDKEEYMRSKKWNAIKKIVIERDKKCFCCGATNEIHVHHIHYLRLGRENLNDLITLCKNCHFELHKKKGYSRQGLYVPKGFQGKVPDYEELKQYPIPRNLIRLVGGGLGYEAAPDKYEESAPIIFDHRTYDGTIIVGSRKQILIAKKDIETIEEINLNDTGDVNSMHGLHHLHKLKNLKRLYLRNCGLTELPEQIGELIYLEELDIGGNQIKQLPDFLGNLTSLRILNLPERDILIELIYCSKLLKGLPLLNTDSKININLAYKWAQINSLESAGVPRVTTSCQP